MAISDIDVWQGEIAELEVDALVVPANESLFMTGRVASVLKRWAGDEVEREAVALGPIPAGTAIVTSGGRLAAGHLIHAVAVGHDLRREPSQLERALEAALALAEQLGLRRIALSPLGIDRGVFPTDEAAELMVGVLGRHPGLEVVIAATSAADAIAFAAAVEAARAGAR